MTKFAFDVSKFILFSKKKGFFHKKKKIAHNAADLQPCFTWVYHPM